MSPDPSVTMPVRKIAVILPNLRGGGAERISIHLAREFLALGYNVEFVLLSREGELLDLVPKGCTIVDLNVARIRSAILPLRRYFKEMTPDAAIANMWPLTSAAAFANWLAGSKTTLATCEHIAWNAQNTPTGIRKLFFISSIRFAYPMANIRLAVSKGAADALSEQTGLERGTITAIENPIPLPTPRKVLESDIDRMWSSKSKIKLLNVGTLKPQKNQKLLIEAFALAHRKIDASLVLLGDGSLRSKLEKLVVELGVEDSVHMPGFVKDPGAYYASADLFVLSSDYEGLPTVLIEALGYGLPIVSTNCKSGPDEILENGRFGTLVPVGDVDALAEAIIEAVQQPRNSDTLMARAKFYDPRSVAKRYEGILFG